MPLAAASIFEIRTTATNTGNQQAGYFNPTNPNMLTDLTTNAGTGNTTAPVVSSASYNFVAGDAGKWLYIQNGTNWIPGWYLIASVAANKATLTATIGSAVLFSNNRYVPSTAAGCATTGTPTGGVFTIDYSQADASVYNPTDLASVGASLTLTSAAAGFTPVMVGNGIHQTTTGTAAHGLAQWFEIVTYVNTSTVTTDRTTNDGTAQVAVTGFVGGALSLASGVAGRTDDSVFELAVSSATASSRFFVKTGTYTLGSIISLAANGNILFPCAMEGYNALRGDRPAIVNQPVFAVGANSVSPGTTWDIFNIQMTGTAATVLVLASGNRFFGGKVVNTSTTSTRIAISNAVDTLIMKGEFISYRGRALAVLAATSGATEAFNYIHDSDIGVNIASAGSENILGNIIAGCVTAAITDPTATQTSATNIIGNTLFGADNKLGVAINIKTGSTDFRALNNIIAGFVTGYIHADAGEAICLSDYNDYYNNTTDVSAVFKGANDTALNPQLTNVVTRSGAAATTTAGNHLVQSGALFQTWGVTAGRDYVYVVSGTGPTAGIYGILSVDSETQITVDLTLTANATADKVWQINVGVDFSIGTNLSGLGVGATTP